MGGKVTVISPSKPYLRPHLHSQPKNPCEAKWHCMTPDERQKWVKDQAKQVVKVKTS